MARPQDDAWFVYVRRSGEIEARPADAKGLFALIGCIMATIGAALGTFFLLFRWSPWVAGVAMGAVIVAGVLGTIRLAIAKGRRIG